MNERTRVKLSEQIDEQLKTRIRRLVKTLIIQEYNTYVAFCEDFSKHLQSRGKRANFTDRVLSNKLNRGDIRLFELLEILDFLGYDIQFTKKS